MGKYRFFRVIRLGIRPGSGEKRKKPLRRWNGRTKGCRLGQGALKRGAIPAVQSPPRTTLPSVPDWSSEAAADLPRKKPKSLAGFSSVLFPSPAPDSGPILRGFAGRSPLGVSVWIGVLGGIQERRGEGAAAEQNRGRVSEFLIGYERGSKDHHLEQEYPGMVRHAGRGCGGYRHPRPPAAQMVT